MPSLRGEALRWVSDAPFPGWIEVALVDAEGRTRRFFDKPPIFDPDGSIRRDSNFPVAAVIRVEVVHDGDPLVVSTAPDGIESEDGESTFRVRRSQVQP